MHKLWKFFKYTGITAAIVAGIAYFLLRRRMVTFAITKAPEFVCSPAQVF